MMHECKHGELKTRSEGGKNVQTHQQAIAIALHEAGATNQESSQKKQGKNEEKKKKKENSRWIKPKKEGKQSQDRILNPDHAHGKRK
ncbi:Hypothetical protein GbCGDNIH6_0092 [Granulibacter bethesdensis]|nr:Hypothetical protein GbCGDNIH6_0092 [Granulibacter bethesdensis]